MDLYDLNGQPKQGSNPGYGNDSNVGYSPGQTGPVPPGWAKFDFQMRQYRNMYGNENRSLFARYPLTFTACWYPILLAFSYLVFVMAQPLSGMMFSINVVFGVGFFMLVWILALGFILTALVLFPLMALMMHRRRGGMFSQYFAWTDPLIPWADFDYYENPEQR